MVWTPKNTGAHVFWDNIREFTDSSDFILLIKWRNTIILEQRIRQVKTSPSCQFVNLISHPHLAKYTPLKMRLYSKKTIEFNCYWFVWTLNSIHNLLSNSWCFNSIIYFDNIQHFDNKTDNKQTAIIIIIIILLMARQAIIIIITSQEPKVAVKTYQLNTKASKHMLLEIPCTDSLGLRLIFQLMQNYLSYQYHELPDIINRRREPYH